MKLTKGLSVAGLVLGITGTVCGAAALIFSTFALLHARKKEKR